MSDNYYYIDLDSKHLLSLRNFCLQPRSYLSDFHSHHELEISYVKSGRGQYWVDGKLYDAEEGDIFILNNTEIHSLGIYPDTDIVNMVINFDPRFIWTMESDNFDSRYLKIFFDRSNNFQNRLDRGNPTTSEIRQLMIDIEEEFINKLPEFELMIKVKLHNILAMLIRHYGYTRVHSDETEQRKKAFVVIKRVLDFVDQHLNEDIRLRDMAQVSYMNPSYFSTFFKKFYGMSPMEYIIKKRIHKAIDYLKSSDKSITEITSLCGFNNSSNFNKSFRRVTGKMPSDFRKNI